MATKAGRNDTIMLRPGSMTLSATFREAERLVVAFEDLMSSPPGRHGGKRFAHAVLAKVLAARTSGNARLAEQAAALLVMAGHEPKKGA